jgi:protein O-GlcNAc transferase
LGTVLQAQKKVDDAIACYRRALELSPDCADAHNNLGAALNEQWKVDEALAAHRRALALRPDFPEAHNNLGNAQLNQGKWNEAAESYRRALALRPSYPEAHNNLGNVLKDLGHLDEAVASYRRAIDARSDYAEALNNFGNSLREQGKIDEALACYRRACQLKPDFSAAFGAIVHERAHICDWDGLEEQAQRVIAVVESSADNGDAGLVSPFSFLTLPVPTTAAQQLRCAQQWFDRHLKATYEFGQANPLPRSHNAQAKITVGYLSADFHAHATAWLIAELFEKHDRGRFAIHAYSYGPDDGSPMRRRLVSAFDRFVDLQHASYVEAAQRIAADGVDILVDLKGYTRDARSQILALRPAPIQVSYLGYPGTMGAPFIDYILVDDFVVPADQQPYFTEKLVQLPGCYQVNDSTREIAAHTPSRSECSLPERGFVFCSFNNSYKFTPAVFDVWMRLLKNVPDSVLWLLEGNRFAPANLRREAEARGVPAERLVFAPSLPLPDHLARHRRADLFLDTYPVNAHTTASDALWAGCPILTLVGSTFVSRVAGSLLRTLGLPELITTSLSEYEENALLLAMDPERLAELRARLETNRATSGVFDAARFARGLEAPYERMWELYQAVATTGT